MKYILLALLSVAPLSTTYSAPSPHTKRMMKKNKEVRVKRSVKKYWSKEANVKKVTQAIEDVALEFELGFIEENSILREILMRVIKNEKIVNVILALTNVDEIEVLLKKFPSDFAKIFVDPTCEEGIKDVTSSVIYLAVYGGILYYGNPIITPAAGIIASIGVAASKTVFMITKLDVKACNKIHDRGLYENFIY